MAYKVWKSDDQKCEGTEEEVLAYEAKQKDPLSEMQFPYHVVSDYFIYNNGGTMSSAERVALVAFANLAPLVGELRSGYSAPYRFISTQMESLFKAYYAACELARKVNG